MTRHLPTARPSALARACASAVGGPVPAHARLVGPSAVRILLRRPGQGIQGINGSVPGFGFPTMTAGTGKTNDIEGIIGGHGTRVAAVAQDQQVQIAEAPGVPPRGKPV